MEKKTRHHLIPKSRRGDYKKKKIIDTHVTLKLYETKHEMWHHLFGNKTLQEIILTLHRVHEIKFGTPFIVKPPTHYY